MTDLTLPLVGGIPWDEHQVATHLAAHRVTAHTGKGLPPDVGRPAVRRAVIDRNARVVGEQFAIADIELVCRSHRSRHISHYPRISQVTWIAQSDVRHQSPTVVS